MNNHEWFSELLHDSAAKWGLPVIEGRPLVDDLDNPYPKFTVVETLSWLGRKPWHYAKIDLLTLNGRWSYCGTFSDTGRGSSFGPFHRFCKPYDSREEAIEGAIEWMADGHVSDDMKRWLASVRQPAQLRLFAVEA